MIITIAILTFITILSGIFVATNDAETPFLVWLAAVINIWIIGGILYVIVHFVIKFW